MACYFSGTSASAPFVSGLASLLRAKNPLLSAVVIRLHIDATCVDLGTPGFDLDYGYGRIDAFAALPTLP